MVQFAWSSTAFISGYLTELLKWSNSSSRHGVSCTTKIKIIFSHRVKYIVSQTCNFLKPHFWYSPHIKQSMYSTKEQVKKNVFLFYFWRQDAEFEYLIWVGSSDSYWVEEVFKAMRDRPEVQSHLVGHESVSVVKQVDITPSKWTVLLRGNRRKEREHCQV